MKTMTHLIGAATLLFVGVISCVDSRTSLQGLQTENLQNNPEVRAQFFGEDTVTVVDADGIPVAGATILLGYEVNDPFKGNELKTDVNGVALIPGDWKAALPVSVQAPGYISTTIPDAAPSSIVIQIGRQEGQEKLEIKGEATGFGKLVKDGKVDFGLIMPSFSREKMFAFDASSVISPESDTITVAGKSVTIPSNITLPKQSETYILPITLNKPVYRVFMREPGTYQLYANHGQFPLQRVMNDIRAGKSMFDVVNHFTFFSGGTRQVTVTQPLDKQDIPVETVVFQEELNVKAPQLSSDQIMLSLALMQEQGQMMPTDVKRLSSGETLKLSTNAAASSEVLSVLMVDSNAASAVRGVAAASLNVAQQYFGLWRRPLAAAEPRAPQDFSRISLAMNPGQGGVEPQFLQLTEKPTYVDHVLTMSAPTLPSGLVEVATYMVLTEIEKITSGEVQTERRTRVWEVLSPAWMNQVELPQLTFNRRPDRTYRWEVMFLAQPATQVNKKPTGHSAVNAIDLSTVTHVTRNALDI